MQISYATEGRADHPILFAASTRKSGLPQILKQPLPAATPHPYAATSKRSILGRRLRDAFHISYPACISYQKLGWVPSASDSRSDISVLFQTLFADN
jgi:hypothetical protein